MQIYKIPPPNKFFGKKFHIIDKKYIKMLILKGFEGGVDMLLWSKFAISPKSCNFA